MNPITLAFNAVLLVLAAALVLFSVIAMTPAAREALERWSAGWRRGWAG